MTISIIVAFCSKTFGIGIKNKIPWNIPRDLKRFSTITKDSVVIMGHNTYMSLPEKPLKNRFNVVITKTPSLKIDLPNVVYVGPEEVDSFIGSNYDKIDIFIIGGASIYKKYMGVADHIYATIIEKEFECDTFFPLEKFNEYEISSYDGSMYSEEEQCNYRFINYKKKTSIHSEYSYLNLLKNVMAFGNMREDRTCIGTKSLFAPDQLRFDISHAIPLYTTKFVGIKMVIKELLWFLKGQTDSKLLESQGVNIWKGNTSREFLDKRGLTHYREGDTGPLYGCLRWYGAEYEGCGIDHRGKGVDQISNLINGLKNDPFSRRHIMTTFNPSVVDKCVLYPCHGICIMMYVEKRSSKNALSCQVTIRSNDLLLGNPVNVASYAIFVHIIAKIVDMVPKDLIISIGDAHLYSNHFEQAALQVSRDPLPFPVLEISDSIREKGIDNIVLEDFTLVGYLHHPSIKAEMAV